MDQDCRILLLVEPSPASLFHLGIRLGVLLRKLNYEVETARSGAEALQKMVKNPPRVVVSETALPDMSGPELLQRMKQIRGLSGIPVVFATSDERPLMQEDCKRLGCSAYLLKPFEPETLFRTLQVVSESMPRVNIRLATRLQVIVGDGTPLGGAERMEYATAISIGGLFVSTRYPQPRNAVTPVRIFLPHAEVRAKAVVLYSFSDGSEGERDAGMGMKFIEIAEQDRSVIRSFIKDQLAADAAREP